MITREQAIYLTRAMAEALGETDLVERLAHMYGTRGIEQTIDGIQALSDQFGIERPDLPLDMLARYKPEA